MQSNKSIFFIFFFQILDIFALDTTILHTGDKIENGERRLVIVIASYNNCEWYKQNLDSVFEQFYNNFRIIYIDDASNDGTPDLVEAYIHEKGVADKVLLIRNTERRYKMANIYRAFHLCDDADIIIELDGDDWLSSSYVFKVYNEVYSNQNVWLTYGHFMEWPSLKPQRIREMPQAIFKLNKMRDVTANFWAGLRTYYAWLVKQIKIEDLLFEGTFFERSSDAAIMYPLLEMAHSHAKFVGDMLLLHNVQTPLNDHKADRKMQDETFGSVKKKKGYSPLKKPCISIEKKDANSIDLYVYAENESRLKSLLRSLEDQESIGTIYIYGIAPVCDTGCSKTLIFKNEQGKNTLDRLYNDLREASSQYVMILNDCMEINYPFNVIECIEKLESTKALAFMLGVEKSDTEKAFFIEEGLYGMQLSHNPQIMQKNDNVFGIIVNSSHLKALFNTLVNDNNKSFENIREQIHSTVLSQVFLLFEKKRVVTPK